MDPTKELDDYQRGHRDALLKLSEKFYTHAEGLRIRIKKIGPDGDMYLMLGDLSKDEEKILIQSNGFIRDANFIYRQSLEVSRIPDPKQMLSEKEGFQYKSPCGHAYQVKATFCNDKNCNCGKPKEYLIEDMRCPECGYLPLFMERPMFMHIGEGSWNGNSFAKKHISEDTYKP